MVFQTAYKEVDTESPSSASVGDQSACIMFPMLSALVHCNLSFRASNRCTDATLV